MVNVVLNFTLFLSNYVVDLVWNLQTVILKLNNGEHANAYELNKVIEQLLRRSRWGVVSIPHSRHSGYRDIHRGKVLLQVFIWLNPCTYDPRNVVVMIKA